MKKFLDRVLVALAAMLAAALKRRNQALDGCDRAARKAELDALAAARLAAAVEQFKSFEPDNRARLQ